MKASKHLLLLFAIILLVLVGFPVAGANATGNADTKEKQVEKQDFKDEKQEDKAEKQKGKKDDDAVSSEQITSTPSEPVEETQKDSAIEEKEIESDSVPLKEPKEDEKQVEAKTINSLPNSKDETDSGKDNPNKSTQIHLHLKNCVSPVASVFVQLNGEWKEMSNPGNSPLYKLLDGGEFVKDDVSSFKLIFTNGKELVVPVSDVKVGVEANGTVNYWFEKCDQPVIEKNVFFTLNLMIDESYGKIDRAALLLMNGKRFEFKRMNNMLSITLDEEIDLEMVRGLELTSNGKTKVFLLSQLGSGLVTLNEGIASLELNWNMQGTLIESETEEETDAQPVPVTKSNNGTGGSSGTKVWTGDVLPKTGEESRAMFYVLGLLLSAAGFIIRFRNPLKN